MISTVTLLGLMGDPVPGNPEFRYVDFESRDAFDEAPYFSKIPVAYWDRSVSNYLLRIPKGHYAVIFGRVETDPEVGLYVLVEQIRHFQSNLKVHQIKED